MMIEVSESDEKAMVHSSGPEGFDFLHGRWRVRHRKLAKRLVGNSDWMEFPGTLDVRPILGGLGNVDDNMLDDPAGAYLATSLRLFDPATREWTIWWIDGRRPALDSPVTGIFASDQGRFYGEERFEGRQINVRFTYQRLSPTAAQWTQAFSDDDGQSWEVNWIMDFHRTEAGIAS